MDRPYWSRSYGAPDVSSPPRSRRSLRHIVKGQTILIEQGWIRARNFRNSRNKLAYAYMLTPKCIEQKAVIALHFLRRKIVEYQVLEKEIAQLRREAGSSAEYKPR